MIDLISRQAAIDACLKGKTDGLPATNVACDCCAERVRVLPSAQPDLCDGCDRYGASCVGEGCVKLEMPEVAKDTNALNNDRISRKAVKYKLTALVNELEEIFSHIRERNVDDSVCGLCEYDGAYIGQSGDWCNECPGFEKDDCFKLKEKYREEWLKIDG